MTLFQCEVCHTKILESRLQKHHAKVHPTIDHDIYTPLITDDEPPAPHCIETTNASKHPMQVSDSVWNEFVAPGADEKMVHVSCNICSNRMPIESLDQHMKRKHNDVGDQVDAIGTKVNSMSIDAIEVVTATTVATSNETKNQSDGFTKAKNPFSRPCRFTTIPKTDASTTMDEEAYYTIRVSVAQMKRFLNENRIDPKHGHFYLKDFEPAN